MKRFISIFFAHKVLFARKKFSFMFLFERNTAFVLQGSLPGDCHAALAMTEYFVRNITRVCLPESICRIFVLSLFYPVQRTLCHCERSVASARKCYLINIPKGKQTPWHRRVFRVYSLCELAGRSHRKMRKVRASQGRVQVKYLWRRLQGKCNRDIPHDLSCKDGKAR